jgi:hypothetical protein
MLKGLQNVLRAAVEAQVQRFVHISSVAVYGSDPPPEARYETAIPATTTNEYGNIKLAQEQLVMKYARRHGLPFVILRPPHVYGPYSHMTITTLQKLGLGTLPVIDGGVNPCNLVYIDNLIEAIVLSLTHREALGEIFFVTDKERVTWRQYLNSHAALLGAKVPEASASQLNFPATRGLSETFRQLPRVLLSSEFRTMARQIPAAAVVERGLFAVYDALPETWRERILFRWRKPPSFHRASIGLPRYDGTDYLIAGQRRTVEHSSEKAERLLGYTAPVDYGAALKLIRNWLDGTRVCLSVR